MNVMEEQQQCERIRTVIHKYCRAIDERRFDDVMASFSADAKIKHGSYNDTAKNFVGFLSNVLNRMEDSLHTLGGIIVEFERHDLAYSHATFTSFHRISAQHAKVGPVVTNGVDTDWIVAGRYRDTLQLIKGEWKIIDRIGTTDWDRVEPSRGSTARS